MADVYVVIGIWVFAAGCALIDHYVFNRYYTLEADDEV